MVSPKREEGWNESGNRGNERNRREKIRASELVCRATSHGDESKNGKEEKRRKWGSEGREKEEKNTRVRERRDTRERLCRGYMEMLVKYIIPA